jgi:hypothetical protein
MRFPGHNYSGFLEKKIFKREKKFGWTGLVYLCPLNG